jgi:hypothetical protein
VNRCLLALAVVVGVLGPASVTSSQDASQSTPGILLAQDNPYTQQQQWQYQQQQQQAAQQQRTQTGVLLSMLGMLIAMFAAIAGWARKARREQEEAEQRRRDAERGRRSGGR